jgi:hypothetical protein
MAAGAVESEGKNAMKPSRFASHARLAISLVMAMAGNQPGWMGVARRGLWQIP